MTKTNDERLLFTFLIVNIKQSPSKVPIFEFNLFTFLIVNIKPVLLPSAFKYPHIYIPHS